MSKALCALSKQSKNKRRDPAKIKEALSAPKFVCDKCLRMASKKKFLCTPLPLESIG